MNFIEKYWFRALIVLLFAFFVLLGVKLIDPDLGFQIKTGEFILKNGIPQTDPFSYTMPSYKVISHEWLLTIFLYKLHTNGGMFLLSFIFTSVFFLTGYITFHLTLEKSKDKHIQLFNKIAFLVFVSFFVSVFTIRMQVFSWLFMSVLVYLLTKYNKLNFKQKLFLPALFILWANIHGSFVAGIVLLFLFYLHKLFVIKKLHKSDVVIFLASFLVTFINPYFLGNWAEVINTIFDSDLSAQIFEWRAAYLLKGVPIIYPVWISLTLLLIYKKGQKSIDNFLILFYLFFLYQSFFSIRHIQLFAIIALPYGVILWREWYQKFKKNQNFSSSRFQIFLYILILLTIVYLSIEVFLMVRKMPLLSENYAYPREAINYIRGNPIDGNLFSQYNWGGYLILHYPEKKVFIDGRMPSWRFHHGYEGELEYAMNTYNQILRDESTMLENFKKYKITRVLFPQKNSNGKRLDGFKFYGFLEENGWIIIYEDDVSRLYEKQY